jgi:hypothetical protein
MTTTGAIRYYVIDTAGEWLPGRKVLIPPQAVGQATDAVLVVRLTREQIRNSPDIETDRPISRQSELVLYRHYGCTPDWLPLALASAFPEGDAAERERQATAGHYGGDPHLRSAKEVIGYHVAASDGDIGHIDDFLLDERTIRYAVVDTRNWLPGKSVLISTAWIREIRWPESKVFVTVARDAVKNSPEYDPASQVDKEYEARLLAHYRT